MDTMMWVKLKNNTLLLIKMTIFSFVVVVTIYSQDVVWLSLKAIRYIGMTSKSHSNGQFLLLARLRMICKIQEAVA